MYCVGCGLGEVCVGVSWVRVCGCGLGEGVCTVWNG